MFSNPWYNGVGPMLVYHIINRNGQSSTQIVVDFKHPLEGVSFAHCLPNSVPTAMKESMSQNRSQLISSLLSSPFCPFPKRASLHLSKNRTLVYQFLELHEPLKEKNRPNPFLMGKNTKTLSKDPIAVEAGVQTKFSTMYSRL